MPTPADRKPIGNLFANPKANANRESHKGNSVQNKSQTIGAIKPGQELRVGARPKVIKDKNLLKTANNTP